MHHQNNLPIQYARKIVSEYLIRKFVSEYLIRRNFMRDCYDVVHAFRICGCDMQGGYDLKALSDSVCDSFRGVLGMPSEDKYNPELLREEPIDKLRAVLGEVQAIHRW